MKEKLVFTLDRDFVNEISQRAEEEFLSAYYVYVPDEFGAHYKLYLGVDYDFDPDSFSNHSENAAKDYFREYFEAEMAGEEPLVIISFYDPDEYENRD